jgi:hypothetical protein
MRGLASNKKMIIGRHLMTQNINDTMVKQMYMRQRMYAIVEQRLLKPQSFPNRAPQKVVFYLVKKKKKNGGLNTTKVPETFCQRLNDVAESCVSLSLASKKKQTYCNRQCVDGIDAIGMTKLSSRG